MNAQAVLETLDRVGFETLRALLSVLWQSSILLGAVALLALLLRRKAASLRHALWAGALLVAVLLPLLAWAISQLDVPQAPIAVMPVYEPVEWAAPVEFVAVPAGPAPTMPPSPPPRFSLTDYPWALGFAAYCIGAALFLSLFTLARLRIGSWIRKARPVTEPRAVEAFRSARETLRVRRRMSLKETDAVQTAITIGTLRPSVLLPAGFAQGLSEVELRAVAVHEVSHLRRRDPLVLTLASLARAVLFFHPLVWLACRQISHLAEAACDDAVLDVTGEPITYAKMLTRLAEGLSKRSISTELAAGIVLSKSAFLRRVEAILSDRRDQIRRLSRLAMVGLLLGVGASLGLALFLPVAEKGEAKGGGKSAAPARTESEPEAEPRVPVDPFRKELIETMKGEGIEETVGKLADFDDMNLADTSAGWSIPHFTAWGTLYRLLHLSRVRKLLELGKQNPAEVILVMRSALREALANWPQAFEEEYQLQVRTNGSFSREGPSAYEKSRMQAAAATYILAELRDYGSVRVLYKAFEEQQAFVGTHRLHWISRCAVPPPISLFAMHRLISTYPEEKLTPKAGDAHDEYMRWAGEHIKPGRIQNVTRWAELRAESDPLVKIMDPERFVLRDAPALTVLEYPDSFKDGTPIEDRERPRYMSEQAEEWSGLIGKFVQALEEETDAGTGDQGNKELETILSRVAARQARVKTVRCKWKSKRLYPAQSFFVLPAQADPEGVGPPYRTEYPLEDTVLEGEASVLIDGQNFRCDMQSWGWSWPEKKFLPTTFSSGFVDGKGRTLRHGDLGVISRVTLGQDLVELRPILFAYRLFDPVAQHCAKADEVHVVGPADCDGHPCVVIERPEEPELVNEEDASDWRWWLAADMEFCPIRCECVTRRDGTVPYRFSMAYSKDKDGIWRLDSCETTFRTGETGGVPSSCTYVAETATLNGPIEPNEFYIEFPEGAKIVDEFAAGAGAAVGTGPEAAGTAEGATFRTEAQKETQQADVLRWVDLKSGDVLFTVADIVRFDWDKQLFELKRERAIDLMMLPPALQRDFAVMDQGGENYRGCFMSRRSSSAFDGPTILADIPRVAPPLYQIDAGYPGRIEGGAGDNARFNPRLKAALDAAGVLGAIDPAKPPEPIKTTFSGWHGGNHGLKIALTLFPETFRLGREARFALRIHKDETFDLEPGLLILRVGLRASTDRLSAQDLDLPVGTLDKAYYAYHGTPWGADGGDMVGTATLEIELWALRNLPEQEGGSGPILGSWSIPGQTVQILPATQQGTEGATFGSVIERTINKRGSGAGNFIDFDSGALFSLPAAIRNDRARERRWVREMGIDATEALSNVAAQLASSTGQPVPLISLDLACNSVPAEQWDASAESIVQGSSKLGKGALIFSATYIFKTREGGIGILQIVGFTEDPPGVTIRYKIVQQVKQTGAGAAEAPWGEAVEGVQVRLRAEKRRWMTNELPAFRADIRNMGRREFLGIWGGQRKCQLQVDGRWYEWSHMTVSSQGEALGIGKAVTDVLITLSPLWQEAKEDELNWRREASRAVPKERRKRLELDAGRHTVRVAFVVDPTRVDTGDGFRVISNPVQIEVKESPASATANWPISSDLAQALVDLNVKHNTMVQAIVHGDDAAKSAKLMAEVLQQAHKVEGLAAGTALQSEAEQFVDSMGALQQAVAQGDEQALGATLNATGRAHSHMLDLATGETEAESEPSWGEAVEGVQGPPAENAP